MSISGGIDWVVVQRYIARWVAAGTGLDTDNILWSQNKAPRPAADGIVMRIMGIEPIGDPWVDIVDNPLEFADVVVEQVDFGANTLIITGHALQTGDGPINIESTLTLPGPLEADTNYWVIKVDDDTIQLADTYIHTGGADIDGLPSGNTVTTINLADAGSGVITVSATPDSLRAGAEILHVARATTRATLLIECHTEDSVGMDMAVAVLHRLVARSTLPSQVALLEEAGIGVSEIGRVRAIRGHLDALLFEPRAALEVLIIIASEDEEAGTIIQSADITPTISDVVFPETRFRVGNQ